MNAESRDISMGGKPEAGWNVDFVMYCDIHGVLKRGHHQQDTSHQVTLGRQSTRVKKLGMKSDNGVSRVPGVRWHVAGR